MVVFKNGVAVTPPKFGLWTIPNFILGILNAILVFLHTLISPEARERYMSTGRSMEKPRRPLLDGGSGGGSGPGGPGRGPPPPPRRPMGTMSSVTFKGCAPGGAS